MSETLHFRVSAGLKNIIGKELINDKFIAIFELVKNSYDAGAKTVTIKFINIYGDNSQIIISDDGNGMAKEDIINKWLFVAYSEKKNQSYRDNLIKRRSYAGAKGVGRFSCDRLGEKVQLLSKTLNDNEVNLVKINWNDFEKTDSQEFRDINVFYDTTSTRDITDQGTVIIIEELREEWNRDELLKLKKALTQLVNPDATENYDRFNIILDVSEEIDNDEKETKKTKGKNSVVYDKDIVNGRIVNYVFEALSTKTTKIEVEISEDGKSITTILNDRGIKLFEIIEKNKYRIKNIKGALYSLNSQAKANFTRIMGIQSVNYGSVFIYKNGFRVYPYGEPDKDFMNIDRRKAQGYNRYLGTREINGRIDIYGDNNIFIETSSRNNGFIASYEMTELENFFYEYMLKPLEKYVVNIFHWGEEFVDAQSLAENIKDFDDLEAILKKIKARFKEDNLINAEYNQDIMQIINERKKKAVSEDIEDLKIIARDINDDRIVQQAEKVEKKTKELVKRAKESQKAVEVEAKRHEETKKELEATKKQVGVLQSRVDVTADSAVNAMHIMKAYADTIDSDIEEIFELVRKGLDFDEMKEILHEIRQTCSKIMNAYNLVINTEYNADTGNKELDIVKFAKTYVQKQWSHKFNVYILGDSEMKMPFNPLEFSIVIDNIVDNSRKANANKLDITFSHEDKVNLITFQDDGYGLETGIDVNKIFEQGFTTTSGTGIGLYTVKKYIDKMQATISVNQDFKAGFELQVRF